MYEDNQFTHKRENLDTEMLLDEFISRMRAKVSRETFLKRADKKDRLRHLARIVHKACALYRDYYEYIKRYD